MTMAKANVDPAELRRFARDLNRFNTDLQALMNALHSRLRGLEQTWQDQEQHKFAEEFEQAMKTLGRFLEMSGRHVGFLVKKAGHIEDYLQQR
jgi:WXG100 family type VII secretion target